MFENAKSLRRAARPIRFLIGSFVGSPQIELENSRLKQEVLDYSNVLSVMAHLSAAIVSELEPHDLYRTILSRTAEVLKAEQGSVMIYDETSKELSIRVIQGLDGEVVENLRIKPGEGISGLVFETGQSLLVKNVEVDRRFQAQKRTRYKTKSFISVPLKLDQRKIGVLNVTDKIDGGSFGERDLKLLEPIATHASLLLERFDSYRRTEILRKISVTDPLTDLFNRRYFQDRLTEEIERAKRHAQSVSLILLDIDNFKKYNDTHGHLAGDKALSMTARIIKASVRNIDIVTRYGGEEFAVILPVTQTTAAEDIAERIRVGIASQDGPVKPLGNIIRLTASLGIACFPGDADNLNDLVENADRALYLAKLGGKNRVVIFDKVPSVKRTEEFLC